MIDNEPYIPTSLDINDWQTAKCDKYDFMIAAFCGGVAGLIDVFFVGDPLTSKLGKSMDKVADGFTKKAAQMFWIKDPRQSGKPKKMPQTLEQCISYLEQAFPVNYDARYSKDLMVKDGVLARMRPSNHHLMSLAHSPDPIGLIFSIIDQFMGYATFIDNGKLIHVIPKKTSGAIPYLQGTTLPSMLFCGFVNWIGHLMSDLVGSSSTRKEGKTGRGAGIPMPFYELFLFCDFGNIDGKTFSNIMVKVFEEGYDTRFATTMAIPVIMEELMIKVIWVVRQKYIRKKSWNQSYPTKDHTDLRIMLIVGNSTLCIIDGADSALHGIVDGGFNIVSFVCHLNIVGWMRLITLVLSELKIRYGPVLDLVIREFIDNSMAAVKTPAEKKLIYDFNQRLEEYQDQLDILFIEYTQIIEKEYQELYFELKETFDDNNTSQGRAEHSITLAEISGVEKSRIVVSRQQVDEFFS
ncbi:hypothetical protein SAMN05216349_108124 [Oribacterium sp. KHPX15]|uniref:hypothetical protein n=1 Tax=Oribacterium sp. KHPX15 TaxID=1855342 RepID=UPI000895430D|nr:hypothetical protein [Oribacterium sp. KHPX15]SEA29235.1 hypothetical protein SAMN05216349_108124 [Oribacterium sp. KHPX15]